MIAKTRSGWAAAALACAVMLAAACRNREAAASLGQGPSGSRARDYLSDQAYGALLVEVDHTQGEAPDPQALALLETRLRERCRKSSYSVVQGDAIPDPGRASWRLEDIRELERRFRGDYTAGGRAVLYIVYLSGGSEWDTQDAKVLGVSYSGSSIAIFKDNVGGAATTLITGAAIERAVLVHELGHNLGLVHNGIAMRQPHEDPQHPAHDASSDCVMYWAVESSLVSQLLGAVPDQFDPACIDDLRDAGGL